MRAVKELIEAVVRRGGTDLGEGRVDELGRTGTAGGNRDTFN